jgi:hypothetical protein
MTEQRTKVRDLPPTAVRLDPELRHALAREAAINGRSLHGEILQRLKRSLLSMKPGKLAANEPMAPYAVLSDQERALLSLFRRLSPEKQLALLSLLKQ